MNEEEYRLTNMVVNYTSEDSAIGWSASSITARGGASNSTALGAVEALVFDIENPQGIITLIPRDSRSLANGTRYCVEKTVEGYIMEVYNQDYAPANDQDTVTEAKYAMDVGVFMTEWAEEKRRLQTAFEPGVFLTDYANNGLVKEKGSYKLTADHLPSGDPAPFRLKVPAFLPQHIQSEVDKRKEVNGEGDSSGKGTWFTLRRANDRM